MVEILSKGTWLVSFVLNLSANNCFSTYFNYVDPLCIIDSGAKLGHFKMST